MAITNGKTSGGGSVSGPGVGERAPAGKRRKAGKAKAVSPGFDPASRPESGRSLAEEEQRQFHATHFTADPRGSAMAGAPPGARRRRTRGGTPPDVPARDEPVAKPKRRGGAGPA